MRVHAVRPAALAVLGLLLSVALVGCGGDDPGNDDPAQVDAVEAPEVGACRLLTPADVAAHAARHSSPHAA